ncbi:outer membrane cobalamin receptor protein [Burkholderiales bacterium JOSHI_001]|nr:outer membrane cobalamin receptor protein [Burkholderiales bacterium JOSHI_001]
MIRKRKVLRAPLTLAARVATGMAALCLAAAAQAQPQVVVVTANRAAQPLSAVFAATTVLERADIERAVATDLVGLLARLPGVEVARTGGPGSVTGVFLRGAESRQTLVLVDGVPLSDLSFGLGKLQALGLAEVQRIEVARGNLSSVYGSSALGGVIQIFTQRPAAAADGVSGGAQLQAGRYGTALAAADLAWQSGGTRVGLDVSLQRTDGFNAILQDKRAGTNPDTDGFRQQHAGAFLEHRLNAQWNAQLRLNHNGGVTQYDSEFGPDTQADESRFGVDTASASLAWHDGPMQSSLQFTRGWDRLRAEVTAFPFWVRTDEQRLAWDGGWTYTGGQRLTAGLERSVARIGSDTVYNRSVRGQTSARLGLDGQTGPHSWQANVRHDGYSDFGSVTTGLLGYGHEVAPGWRVSGTLSNGFNAPTFNDLFYPFGGNAALRPETSLNRELALDHTGAHGSLRATWFDQRVKDLIGNDSAFNRVNIDRAHLRGLEFSASWDLGAWRVAPSFTVQDPEDGSGRRLPRRARQLADLSLSTLQWGIQWQAQVHHVGKRFDNVANTRALPAHTLLDLGATWALDRQLTLDAKLRNATDRAYETAWGYRQPGRELSVALRWRWR